MKTRVEKLVCALLLIIATSACSSTQSLQEYYVDNANNPNFLSVDLPVSLLNMEKADLTEDQREALGSLKKLNILAFKITKDNLSEFQKEKALINSILKNGKFTELMKMNTSFGKASVRYLGDDEAIDEVVIYGDSDDKGFMLVRVLGKNMSPAKLVQFMKAVEKSDYKGEGLGEIGNFLKG
ncbi:DUF4252 domain-containing protein [Arenibacter sp. F20364]|uniref:DUF4252 domain-containing protein n=1 Tax=Arenibacter sp. F20364 TaxID=2926415 RepID=UPI001FF2726D|nr:DUF4252 domain-containing protein [Arenibacter sp. F20364]MCK0190119.1 DUF4252 domain-containing protein [Arenibacter sp. F20364]